MAVDLLASLNPEQRLAVTTHDGPLLILAGAGSGKTRVITHRIASLLEAGVPQRSILALTFTNKAAREMAERVATLTDRKLRDLTVSTFHSFGVSILRREYHRIGYRENFTIYDVQDQLALLKESAREVGVELEPGEAVRVLDLNSRAKTGRIAPNEVPQGYRDLLDDYARHLRLFNAFDFDDLIAMPLTIFSNHEEVLDTYQERYRYIMVDEFQDTSSDQYQLLRFLAGKHRNVAVVGDDDQSIYSWRGADYTNFQAFEADFPEYLEVKLEQNYRSTDTILEAANGVIANNANRKSKRLWSGADAGRPIELHFPADETAEGIFIAEMIKTLAMREGIRYGDVGVLVRTNSLTRSLEVAFLSENVPYKVSGGESFFQRREIKDIVAYLRLLANPDDDVSMLRVLNTPRRGVGRRTLEKLVEIARSRATTLYSAATMVAHAADTPLAARAAADLASFVELIESYRPRMLSGRDLAGTTEQLVEEIDYWAHLVAEHQKNDKLAKWKYRNVQLFTGFIRDYESNPDTLKPSVFEFLNRITLDPRDEVNDQRDAGSVNLMTIHAAKGLEHRVVFIAGCEDGIMPHRRSIEENEANIEEERRLFYVALTRAKEKLHITSCRSRKILREVIESLPSPFLAEIPEELVSVSDPAVEVSEEEGIDYFAALKDRLT